GSGGGARCGDGGGLAAPTRAGGGGGDAARESATGGGRFAAGAGGSDSGRGCDRDRGGEAGSAVDVPQGEGLHADARLREWGVRGAGVPGRPSESERRDSGVCAGV